MSLMLSVAHSARANDQLLLVGQSPQTASLASIGEDDSFQFLVGNQTQITTSRELVRWSAPRINLRRRELLLNDGSRLVLADAWSKASAWSFNESQVSATTNLLGQIEMPRQCVRAIVLRASQSEWQRTKVLDQLYAESTESGGVRLINGDRLAGKIVGIESFTDGPRGLSVAINSTGKPLRVDEDRIAAITFDRESEETSQQASFVVGLSDGSQMIAKSLVADDGRLQLTLTNGVELTGTSVRDIVYLRSLNVDCVYLSNLTTSGYRHVPYLDLPWAYRRDRNVLGGRLRAAGQSYDKGIGMHTASRLSYRLESGETVREYRRFVASIAVDDAAGIRGSVVFRVYIKVNGQWQSAFESSVLRGGDAPVPVTVELDDATELALVTDYADRGDECDYANWLEARLE